MFDKHWTGRTISSNVIISLVGMIAILVEIYDIVSSNGYSK